MEGRRENQEEYLERDDFSFGNRDQMNMNHEQAEKAAGDGKGKVMPPTSVMTRLILIMVWRKLIRNPNTYSSLIGLTWSLVSFRYLLLASCPFLCFTASESEVNPTKSLHIFKSTSILLHR